MAVRLAALLVVGAQGFEGSCQTCGTAGMRAGELAPSSPPSQTPGGSAPTWESAHFVSCIHPHSIHKSPNYAEPGVVAVLSTQPCHPPPTQPVSASPHTPFVTPSACRTDAPLPGPPASAQALRAAALEAIEGWHNTWGTHYPQVLRECVCVRVCVCMFWGRPCMGRTIAIGKLGRGPLVVCGR